MFSLFPRTGVKAGTLLSGFSPHLPAWLHVCVFHWDLGSVFTHITLEERMNADDTVSDAKNGLFCSTTISSCRKFAFLPTEQCCSFWAPDTSMMLHSDFCHHSAITNHCWEVWSRVAHFFLAFQWINVSFKYLPQIFFQISENTQGKFEETTRTSVDVC